MTMKNYLNDYPNNPLVAALLNLEQLRDADELFDVEVFCYAEVMMYMHRLRDDTNEPICERWFPDAHETIAIDNHRFFSHRIRSERFVNVK